MKHKTMFNPLNLVQHQKKLNRILVIQNKLICKDTRIQTQNIKKQNTNSMCSKKLYQHRKNLQKHNTLCFRKSNHQKWFETTHKRIISQIQNVLNYVPIKTKSNLNYLKLPIVTKIKTCNYHKTSNNVHNHCHVFHAIPS